ncbi:MAG: beta-galactosidase [Verrucomicrobiae bacterium]|nr:beta-galactosidase [Verrucomicrobiae bacterium]
MGIPFVIGLMVLCACGAALAAAAPLNVNVGEPQAPEQEFKLGHCIRPDGATLTMDNLSLLLDGRRWTPVMGEFHYARHPENEWRDELLKMKAGGIDIVATYVFWIHHEEIEGQWDWSGRRNLRRFVELCNQLGLKVVVRCGPWCHGEARNGGFPDWLLQKGWKLRSNDSNYLARVRILYGKIAEQLTGLLWKDGGPVIGIQLENEYRGPAEHLLALKKIARDAGLDVPLYTRTGWPALSTPMPFGEILPLYGVYAEGFWDRELTPMPGRYWAGFHFSLQRTDANIANEILGRSDAKDPPDTARYPYLTCEIGPGMLPSYHRRIRFYPEDAEAITLVKIGSGSVLPGYYMYHGGVNPEGKLTTLQESQATGYWNDVPVKSYDFQTALGEYGQVRPQYHLLRRLHLFMHSFGAALAEMPTWLPEQRPAGKADTNTLRWCVRSDGKAGFVFVNNYERLRYLPPKQNVQFKINLAGGTLVFPDRPVTVHAGSRFIWPFNLTLGSGAKLLWATAQPVCALQEDKIQTLVFAETRGVPATFAIVAPKVSTAAKAEKNGDMWLVRGVNPSRDVAITVSDRVGKTIARIVLLSERDSLALYQLEWRGRDRLFLTDASLVVDGPQLRLSSTNHADLALCVYPFDGLLKQEGRTIRGQPDGIFRKFTPSVARAQIRAPQLELIKPPGPPRQIRLGKINQPVAAAPEDADFEHAAVWRVKLPPNLDLNADPILRVHYVGDVARITLNGKLLTDDFYNGNVWEIGLRRHAPEILTGDLRIAILPLQKDAPIYLQPEAIPDFTKTAAIAELNRLELVQRQSVTLVAAE